MTSFHQEREETNRVSAWLLQALWERDDLALNVRALRHANAHLHQVITRQAQIIDELLDGQVRS